MMETAARNIVAAMQKHGVRRLASTSGAGVRDEQDQPKLMDHIMKGLLTLLICLIFIGSLDLTPTYSDAVTPSHPGAKRKTAKSARNSGHLTCPPAEP